MEQMVLIEILIDVQYDAATDADSPDYTEDWRILVLIRGLPHSIVKLVLPRGLKNSN